jgi:hypothetical protein
MFPVSLLPMFPVHTNSNRKRLGNLEILGFPIVRSGDMDFTRAASKGLAALPAGAGL